MKPAQHSTAQHGLRGPENSCCDCEVGVSPSIKNPTAQIFSLSLSVLVFFLPTSRPLESRREMAAASTALRLLFVPHLPTSAAVPVRLRGPPLLLPLRSLSSSLPRSRSRLSPVVFAQSNLFKDQYQLGCGLAAAREKEEEGDEEGKPRDLVPLSLNNPDPLLPSFVIADEEKTLPPPLLLVASDEEKNATSSR
ncbi:hypothetical protein BHE74_00056855 [Ensete ventricosum]|nr:hypothetical protein BHE74_00056855 [Ensete ventricosum]